MKTKKQIITQFKKHLKESKAGLSNQYNHIKSCQAFYAGDFMDYKDKVQFNAPSGKKRAMVQFNQVKPYVNAVKGFMAQNRRNAKYVARVEGTLLQKQYSVYANSLKDYLRENCDANQTETQQDGDFLIGGVGAVETALTYAEGYATTDPNGEVAMGKLDMLSTWWDKAARKTNLLDAKYCGYSQIYHIDEALDLFKDSDEEDFEGVTDEEVETTDFKYLPNGGAYDKYKEGVDWADEKSKMANVHFYKWYEIVRFYRAENPINNLTNPTAIEAARMQMQLIAQETEESGLFIFNPDDEILNFDAKIKAQLEEIFGEYIDVYDHPRKVFYEAVISGDTCFTAYESISQQGFSIQFKTGDWDAKNKIWTGMVASMREPTKYYNKALTELMFTISANSKGGVLIEKGAVEDIRTFEAKYAKTDAVCEVEEGALTNGRIQPKKEPFMPSGYESIVALSADAITQVNGIDKSFLGSSENRMETAALQRQRIKQVVSTLACYFDSITLYQKQNARLFLEYMRVYAENNANGLFRILGEDGKETFVRISKDRLLAEFDVTIQEAPQTPEEKVEQGERLMTMASAYLAVGDVATSKAISAIALKYLNIEQEDVLKLMEVLTPEGDEIDPAYVQRLEKQVQQFMDAGNKIEMKRKLSDIALNEAKREETMAKVTGTQANTTKTLEEARNTALENDLVVNEDYDKVNISI